MSEDALTGFLAWLEAAPPGQRVNVACVVAARSSYGLSFRVAHGEPAPFNRRAVAPFTRPACAACYFRPPSIAVTSSPPRCHR